MSKPPLLREAAGRGVLRVRLLLDDLYTDGLESLINGLGAHANVEIRLFNPLPTRGSVPKRFAVVLLDFERLNRRMHSRLFIVDRVMAVTGGRNLCDEYFMRSARSNFFDYDAFVVGPVVSQVSSLFDEYWNAEQVWTAASAMRPEASAQELREAFNELISHKRTPEPQPFRGRDRLGQMPLVDELQAGRVRLVYGLGQTDRTVQKRVGAAESLRL